MKSTYDQLASRWSAARSVTVALALLMSGGLLFVAQRGSVWRLPSNDDGAGNMTRSEPAIVANHVNRVVLAAPGRIEGVGEVIEVGAGADGVLIEVRAREGQQVMAGYVLARVACGDLEAERMAARAAAESANQARKRLLRGGKDEERRIAANEAAAAAAVLKQAQAHDQRMTGLYETGDISRETWEKARRDQAVAAASWRAAQDRQALANALPLPEELARAEAEARGAEERANAIAAKLDKCAVRAPITGRVLRCHRKVGETVSAAFPRPIISLADTSRLRVRAEVDERDLSRLRLGQPVVVVAEAFPERRFAGRVSSVGALMSRPQVRTGDPAEKSDREVLEVWVDLAETDERLVVGLRTTVRFLER